MYKETSSFLDQVCQPIRSNATRLLVRAELSGHVENLAEEFKLEGYSDSEAFSQAIAQMGDPAVIGKNLAALHSPVQNILVFAAGVLSMIAVFAWLSTYMTLEYFLDVNALLFVMALTVSLVLLGGLSRLTRRTALQRARVCALYAGGIGAILGGITTLGNLANLTKLGPSASFCVTSLLYGVLTSALIGSLAYLTRPMQRDEIRKALGLEEEV